MRNHRGHDRVSALFLLSLILAAGAEAQTSPVPASADEARGDLEEIVVTARRRAESLQDVPASVTSIGDVEMERLDLTSLEKIAASVPQLVIGRTAAGSGVQIVLRGIGSSAQSSGIEQSAAVIIDGVYYSRGRIINEGLLDVARVEILKGPQALFFGKNATAGVISITTADPGDETEILARAGYEFEGQTVSAEGVFSAPLSNTLGIRIAGRASKMHDGYIRNLSTAQEIPIFDAATFSANSYTALPAPREEPQEENVLGRITVQWTPTDRLTATVKASGNRYRTNNPGWNNGLFSCPDGVYQLNPAIACERDFQIHQNNLPNAFVDSGFPLSSSDGSLYEDYDAYSFTGTLDYSFDRVELTSITNYQHNDSQRLSDTDFGSSLPGGSSFWLSNGVAYDAFSNETRILTNYDGRINVLAGMLYQRTDFDIDFWVHLFGVENSAAADPANRFLAYIKTSNTNGETLSGYSQVIWEPTPDLELTAGFRYIHETKDSDFNQPYVNPLLAANFILNPQLVTNQTFDEWSPEITASWQPQSDVTIYAAYKTGYKSGGFSGSGAVNASSQPGDLAFGPESAEGFEVGLKSTLLDNQLRLNASAYSYEYSGLQTDFFNSVNISFVTFNGGTAKAEGVELEAEWAPLDFAELTLKGSANYNDAHYENFEGPCFTGQTPTEGCTLTGPGGALFQDLGGTQLLGAPLWTGFLGSTYETPLTGNLDLVLSAYARYSDEYNVSVFGNPDVQQPSYVNVDASVIVGTEDRRWELALIGRNLTDEFVINGVFDAGGTGSGTGTPAGIGAAQVGFMSFPRTVQLQLTYRY